MAQPEHWSYGATVIGHSLTQINKFLEIKAPFKFEIKLTLWSDLSESKQVFLRREHEAEKTPPASGTDLVAEALLGGEIGALGNHCLTG